MNPFKRILGLGLVVAVIGNSSMAVLVAGEEKTSRAESLKEKALAIAPGTMVEVKLVNKEKFRGRIGDLSDAGFTVQTAEGNKIEKKTVSFDQLKSIKTLQGKGSGVSKGVVYVLAGAGALALTGIIICATGGCSGD